VTTTDKGSHLKGLVFDLDDTLYLQADYKRSGFAAVAKWLKQNHNIDQHITIRLLEKILLEHGPSHPFVFDDFSQRCRAAEGLVPEMVRIFINHTPQIKCFHGVPGLLRRLRNSYHLGLLTDGRHQSQQCKVKSLGIGPIFDHILYSDTLKLNKPAEALFQFFEKTFTLHGHELAYIGDNPQKDFYGAKQRGWQTIRVRTGEHARLEASGNWNADIDLNEVSELDRWLELSS